MNYVIIEMGVHIIEKTNRIREIWFTGYNAYTETYQTVRDFDKRISGSGLLGPIFHKPYKILR